MHNLWPTNAARRQTMHAVPFRAAARAGRYGFGVAATAAPARGDGLSRRAYGVACTRRAAGAAQNAAAARFRRCGAGAVERRAQVTDAHRGDCTVFARRGVSRLWIRASTERRLADIGDT